MKVADLPSAAPPPGAPPTEDPRVRAAAAGDPRARQALLQEMLPRVRNLVRYLVRGDRDVDDLAQEALIAVLRGLPTYRGEGTFKAWADRVVARTTLSAARRSRRERALEEAGPDLSLLPHPDGPPDEYASRRELVRCLDQLPDEQRHALVLHHVLGLSVPEVAEQLAVPFETVRSRLRLGQGRLRALVPGGEAAPGRSR